MCVCVCVYINPPLRTSRMPHSFKENFTGLNSEFFLSTSCHTKVKEHSLPYYSFVDGEGK